MREIRSEDLESGVMAQQLTPNKVAGLYLTLPTCTLTYAGLRLRSGWSLAVTLYVCVERKGRNEFMHHTVYTRT